MVAQKGAGPNAWEETRREIKCSVKAKSRLPGIKKESGPWSKLRNLLVSQGNKINFNLIFLNKKYVLLGLDAVKSGRELQTVRKNVQPPSSGSKSNSNKQT
jgi:hypothetical protein